MKHFIIILLIIFNGSIVRSNEYWSSIYSPFLFYKPLILHDEPCVNQKDISSKFTQDHFDFLIPFFLQIASESKQQFNLSPLSMWMSLAAIAEGSVEGVRQELFEFLKLPEDRCIRQQYYAYAKSLLNPRNGVTFSTKSFFVIDENLLLKENWKNIVSNDDLSQILTLPLQRNPEESLDTLRHITSAQLLTININGNCLLLDTFDLKISWNTVFLGATIERAPFYNEVGEELATVNMIKMKKRAKVAYLPEINYKVLELPIGYQSQYRLLIGTTQGASNNLRKTFNGVTNDVIKEIEQAFRLSRIPIDISIPQYFATTEIDLKSLLEKLGLNKTWNNSYATSDISYPPAILSGFVQRASVTIDQPARHSVLESNNFVPAIDDMTDEETGLDPEIGRDFIINKPFVLGLFDAKSYTCLFTSIFSNPGINKD